MSNAVSNPEYAALSDSEKFILKMSVMFNSMGKEQNNDVYGFYARKSAVYANSVLDKFNLSQDAKERIVNIVRYHNFYEDKDAKFSKYFRSEGDAKIAKIAAQADYKAKTGNELDVSKYKTNWQTNALLLHKNPLAAQKYPSVKLKLDGKTVEQPLLYLENLSPDTDMFAFGYPKGTTLKDITVQIHSTDIKGLEFIANSYENPNQDIVLSTSVKKLNASQNGYGKGYQAVLSTSKNNRGGGSYTNTLMSGIGRGFDDFYNEILNYTDILPEAIKEKYGKTVLKQIEAYFSQLSSPTQIKDLTVDGKLIPKAELTGLWKAADKKIMDTGINEVLAINPKIEQIIINDYVSPDKIPQDLLRLAQKYHIPIVVSGKKSG